MKFDPFIYGQNQIEGIVGIEYQDGKAVIFKESKYGDTERIEIDHKLFCLYSGRAFAECESLDGNLHFNEVGFYASESELKHRRYSARAKGYDVWVPRTETEGILIGKGITFFKGLDPEDVSVLALDLETVNINPRAKDSKILIISATYRKGDYYERKEFCYNDYMNEALMVADFADFVRRVDPAMIIGYNILGFDLPYIHDRGHALRIARNRSTVKFDDRPAEKRKDASQSYTFIPARAWGRQVVDLLHLTIEYDLASGRKLPSYRLKEVMQFLGLEREGRAHYDASKIKANYTDPVEWQKIRDYCADDADDCIKLLDHIWKPFFYYTQNIPMTFERMTQTSSGAKVNNFMIRAYLQEGHSIPDGDPKEGYPGGVVIGRPGYYEHVYKVDVKSMYPSIIIRDNICVENKDPLRVFPRMVKYFTDARLKNKALYAQTKDPNVDALQGSQKIFINSCYGYLGAPRLNFNSMAHADAVTAAGRDILSKGIKWAETKGFSIVNADTDSFSFTCGKKLDNFPELIKELNSLYSEVIEWENDGYYPKTLIVAPKNYVLVKENGGWIMKGNSLKATMKEPALARMIDDFLRALIEKRSDELVDIYNSYVVKAGNIGTVDEMREWASKKTVTKAVLVGGRTNEARIMEAIDGTDYSEADKIRVFFETDTKVSLVENFNGTYDKRRLYAKIHGNIKTFKNLIDMSLFTNYSFKRSQTSLDKILSKGANKA